MKKLLLIGGMLTGMMVMQGAPVSPESALTRAIGNVPAGLRGEKAQLQLVDVRLEKAEKTVYLFAGEPGFVIAPADDMLPAVLGYGTTNVKTVDGTIPDNFNYWMDFLSRRVAQAVAQGGVPHYARPEMPEIPMLCQTKWNQDSPYNDQCPELSGSKCPTGCVATAMSQAVKYHNWPITGSGTSSYTWKNGSRTLSYNYGETTYDWDNMLNSYNGSSSLVERRAVSTLMKDMGGSVEMMYGANSSGAYSANIAGALATYFRYGKDVQYLLRDYYSLMEWEEIIYNTLLENGPVIYGGQAPVGGHSFICDGYQGEGYFHINWGWGGTSDGYFLLDVLDPYDQGIGGASGYAFNDSQDAVVNLHPDTLGTSQPKPAMMWGSNGYNTWTNREIKAGGSFSIGGGADNNGYWNYGPFPIPASTKIGFTYENMYTGAKTYNPEEIGEELRVSYGYTTLTETFPVLEDGIYKIYFSIQDGDTIQPMKVKYNSNQFIIGTVANTTGKMSYPKISMPIVKEIAYTDSCDVNELNLNVTATIHNKGPKDLNQYVRLELYMDNALYAYGDYKPLECGNGETVDFEYNVESLILMTNSPQTLRTADEEGSDGDGEDPGNNNFLPENGDYKAVLAIQNGSDNTWIPISTWKDLKLYGKVDVTSGIDKVDNTRNNNATYIDMQGRKLKNTPKGGVYIKRNGNNAEKILVK